MIETHKAGALRTITLDRPESRNALIRSCVIIFSTGS